MDMGHNKTARETGVGIEQWRKRWQIMGEPEGRAVPLGKKSRLRAQNEPRAGAGLWCQVLSELHGTEGQ